MDMHQIVDLMEAMTIFCFGISWPISIVKSYKSRTAKGKSLMFEVFVLIGYAIGIIRKCVQMTVMHSSGTVFFLSFVFYVINFITISIDIALYFRNRRLDMAAMQK